MRELQEKQQQRRQKGSSKKMVPTRDIDVTADSFPHTKKYVEGNSSGNGERNKNNLESRQKQEYTENERKSKQENKRVETTTGHTRRRSCAESEALTVKGKGGRQAKGGKAEVSEDTITPISEIAEAAEAGRGPRDDWAGSDAFVVVEGTRREIALERHFIAKQIHLIIKSSLDPSARVNGSFTTESKREATRFQ